MNDISSSPMPTTVDVIVPLYNNEKYAIDAINSALAQTYPAQKIIVVDDGSTDRSADIVQQYFANDPRILLIRGEHRGLPATRNRAIARSEATFLAFLDSDDIWYPTKVERQVALLANDPDIGLVYCAYNDIDEKGNPVKARHQLVPRLRGFVHDRILRGNLISGGSAALVRRKAWDEAGPFDETLPFGEDWDMWLRLAKICKFDYVPEPLLSIRRHSTQMTAGNNRRRKMLRLVQHLRIWSKWPEEAAEDWRVQYLILRILTPLIFRACSCKRWVANLHVVHRKIIVPMHPQIARSLYGRNVYRTVRKLVYSLARDLREKRGKGSTK